MNNRLLLVAAMLVAGCAAQPKYERPAVELPAAWRESAQNTVADGNWWRIYADPALEKLIAEALQRNANLTVAAARVEEARSLLQQSESYFYPTVDGTAGRNRTRSSGETGLLPPGTPLVRDDNLVRLNVSYEIDIWGRLRSAARAARADLLATQAARDTVRITLAADVARTYFALRALDAQVTATRRTLKLREEGLNLQKKRFDEGLISIFELRQLEAEAATTRAQLPPLERDREIQEAALAVLLGRSPRAIMEDGIERASDEKMALLPAVVPSGLPSELLLRRPDLVEAEQRLVAANAR
ncbi:MAG: efflux transporter outer membrane subunit, partial [Betaproteobacteria bacterium]|nr:efflux transporter outer membrane subunit [Betaproteobacteria bacterium]